MTYLAGSNAFGGTGSLGPAPAANLPDPTGAPYRTTMDGSTLGGSAGTNKLWLPIWSGEVMYAYDQYRVFEPLVESRTIASGRSMEFPITGAVNLKPAWFAGEELLGSTNASASKTFAVSLDARPIATYFEVDNVDLMITQWQYRQELARQAGQTLANARDLQIGAYIVRAACEDLIASDPRLRDTGAIHDWTRSLKAGRNYGSNFSQKLEFCDSSTATDTERADGALAILAAIEDFQIHLQEINAPTDGVFLAVTPQTFHDIRALGVARDADSDLSGGAGRPFFGGVADAGGLGTGLRDGMMTLGDTLEYMSVRIIKTNHLPNFNAIPSGASVYDAQAIGEARYNLDFAMGQTTTPDTFAVSATDLTAKRLGVKGILWQMKCVASLSLQGMKVDSVEDIRRNTNFTVASMMAGTGVLRPECAAVIYGGDIAGATTAVAATKSQLREALGMTAEYIVTA